MTVHDRALRNPSPGNYDAKIPGTALSSASYLSQELRRWIFSSKRATILLIGGLGLY